MSGVIFVRRSVLWSALWVAAALTFNPLPAGSVNNVGSEQDRAQAINSGVELERSRQWLDAIEHYETNLKQYPKNQELEYGLRRAKIHFGVERRYADNSFRKSLLSLSRRDAMTLFDEIIQKIEMYYVEQVTPMSFVAHGTESLYLALADQKFLQSNLPNAAPAEIQKTRAILRERYWNKHVYDLSEAHALVEQICDLTSSNLGLAAPAVILEYVFGGCNALDDYSSFLTPSRLNDLYGNIDGQFVGLGIEMKAEAGRGLLLVNVLPDSPAAEGGLMAGEHLVNIDGTDCRTITTDEAASLLQGLEGSRVTLQVEGRESKLRQGTFLRRPVSVKSIPIARIVDREHGIGYIQMTGFQKTTASELDAALQQLQRQGMRALIWDVRGNPGGLLTAAVEVLDRFISEGVLVSTKGRISDQNWTYTARRTGTLDIPLILLTDGESASASEIVAGAIRDHHRGTIVGRKTYGKWSVQSIYPVRGSTGLRLTTAKFYSPRGDTLGKIGVNPDVLVPEPNKQRTFYRAPTDINLEEDTDLLKGLDVLKTQLAQRQ